MLGHSLPPVDGLPSLVLLETLDPRKKLLMILLIDIFSTRPLFAARVANWIMHLPCSTLCAALSLVLYITDRRLPDPERGAESEDIKPKI